MQERKTSTFHSWIIHINILRSFLTPQKFKLSLELRACGKLKNCLIDDTEMFSVTVEATTRSCLDYNLPFSTFFYVCTNNRIENISNIFSPSCKTF